MATIQDITLFAYNLTLIPIIFLSIFFLTISLLSLYVDKKDKRKFKTPAKLPFITVQVPTFNDPIAARCVKHCMNLDYPKDKYEIHIVDDSTNVETQKLLKKFEEKELL